MPTYKHGSFRSIITASAGSKNTISSKLGLDTGNDHRGSMQHLPQDLKEHQLLTWNLQAADTWEDKGQQPDHHPLTW